MERGKRSLEKRSDRPVERQAGDSAADNAVAGSGTSYTSSDSEKFARLANFSFATPDWMRSGDLAAEAPPGTNYSESDLRAFEALVPGDTNRRGKRPDSPSSTYSEGDDRLFEDLMAFDKRPSASAATTEPRGKDNAFQYAAKDLEAFDRLSPDGPAHSKTEPQTMPARGSSRDRDVGHIKIMDFDKERNRQRENKRRDGMSIKIRYFD